jgi:hypothetical protein
VIRGVTRYSTTSSDTCTRKSTSTHISYSRTANPKWNSRTLNDLEVVQAANSLPPVGRLDPAASSVPSDSTSRPSPIQPDYGQQARLSFVNSCTDTVVRNYGDPARPDERAARGPLPGASTRRA